MNRNNKIFIAGHNGMVGQSFLRSLKRQGYKNLIFRSRKQLDLTNQQDVRNFMKKNQPDIIIIAAAKVGGIYANNTYPSEFFYDNVMISTNIIKSAFENKVPKLLFLGSSCIYPKNSKQPIEENSLLSSFLEPTNEAYAIAKISGIKFCKYISDQYGYDYRSVMPTNLYGLNDNFNLENSHVIPGLIHRMYLAKINNQKVFRIWGTGKPMREFMHVEDLVNASIKILKLSKKKWLEVVGDSNFVNIGVGKQISIFNLSKKIKKYLNYDGQIDFDTSMPDGTIKKGLSDKKFKNFNFKMKYDLDNGLREVCEWFVANYNDKKLKIRL